MTDSENDFVLQFLSRRSEAIKKRKCEYTNLIKNWKDGVIDNPLNKSLEIQCTKTTKTNVGHTKKSKVLLQKYNI